MPRNRRERRAFERKNKSGIWKACTGASALAAVIAAQLGLVPANATAAVTRVVDIRGEDYNGDSDLSLREAIEIARPGDIIDISGVEDDLYVDGPITIDKSLTIIGAGDGVQSIRSLAKRASDWGFNSNNLGDDDRAGETYENWGSNDYDSYVGNTIFDITEQIDRGTDEVVPTTVIFKDVAISGYSVSGYIGENGDLYLDGYYETMRNYLPLITIDEQHEGEVIFDASTIEDTTTVAGYQGFNFGGSGDFHVFMPSASGVANYSMAGAEGDGESTTVSFVNDSHLYNLNFNAAYDWQNQFWRWFGYDAPGGEGNSFVDDGERTYFDFEDNDDIQVSSWGYGGPFSGTGSAVFSAWGNVNFENSFAENNTSYTENSGDDVGYYTSGSVFGLIVGDLSITDSRIEGNSTEAGFGGAGFLYDGDLTISATADGESVIYDNDVYQGSGGAFHLGSRLFFGGPMALDISRDGNYPGGTFHIEGDVTFQGNQAWAGGAIFVNSERDAASTIVGGAYFVNNDAYGPGYGFSGAGGAIFVRGSLSIYAADGETEAARFAENDALYSGGAIFLRSQDWSYSDGDGGYGVVNDSGNLFIQDATFLNNEAVNEDGGAIAVYRHDLDTSDITIEGSFFGGNVSDDEGGAVFVLGGVEGSGDVTIYDTSFIGNGGVRTNDGGALFLDGFMNVSIEESIFVYNEATQDGAGVWVDNDTYLYVGYGYDFQGTLEVKDSGFYDNDAGFDGGAIHTSQDITVTDSNFTGNYAGSDGGAIGSNDNESFYIFNSTFTNNGADDEGGALYSDDDIYIYDSTFEGNYARNEGGAVFAEDDVYIKRSTFENNEGEDGGAVYADENLKVDSSTFVGNIAEFDGGALYADQDYVVITNSTFTGNEAGDDGAVVYNDGEHIYMAFNTIVNQGSDLYYGAGDGSDTIIEASSGDVRLFANIIGDNLGNYLYVSASGNVFDDGYNVVTQDYPLQDYDMVERIRNEKMSILVNWDDLGITTLADNGGPVETFALENSSIAVRFLIPGNVVDWDSAAWLSNLEHVTQETEMTISQIVSTDARGKSRGNLADAGAYEFSVKVASGGSGVGGGGGGGGSTPEPTPTPEPTEPPVANEPVVASVAGFAPGSSVLTKAIKRSLRATVAANSEFKAVVLRGFTVVTSDLRLAKARANAVRKYILRLAPELATKVLKGKLGNSRKVKMTFKDSL